MKKILLHKYGIAFIFMLSLIILGISALLKGRIDLTAEKRYSLHQSTKQLLSELDSNVTIQLYLHGDLPSDYKKLSLATQDLLEDFKSLSNQKITIEYKTINTEGLNDSALMFMYDSLVRMGLMFERTEVVTSSKNKKTDQIICPSALVLYKNAKPFAIDLRSSKKVFKQFDVLNQNPEEDVEATRNAAEALLEYKFANAIDKLTRKKVPTIAYCMGNGEPTDLRVKDLIDNLRNDYRLGIFDLKKAYPNASQIDALVIVKPTQSFTDEDKLKIDQFVMQGGKVLWCVDKLYAELDSLMRSNADFIAYDRNLNIDDILFQYGARINGDLVQDLNCSKIPLVYGSNPDGSPKMQRVPWPYYPFLNAATNHPIASNIDRILPLFPSSIDTVAAAGIKKTILLATDTNSRKLGTPAMVSLNSVKTEEDFRAFNVSHVPVAVLLEGKFTSLFKNRLTPEVLDSVQKNLGQSFTDKGKLASKQIVISDADIVTNAVTKSTGPLPMGTIPFENYQFGNKDFFLNAIDYLVSSNQLYEARNKEFKLRLLDKVKLSKEKSFWQVFNVALPSLLIVAMGFMVFYLRKKKYQ